MSHERPPPGHLRLLTGVAGAGKTHRALSAIRSATTVPGERGGAAGRPGDALLILPTYAQVLHMKRVVLSRFDVRGILDEPFTTFTAAGERFLDGFRVRALPTADERDALMEAALRQAAVPLFEAVADRPGFRAHALRLVKEVKQTGIPAGEARARLAAHADVLAGAAKERLVGFLTVFEAYDQLLARAGLEDHEDTLRRLLEQLLETPPERAPEMLVVDGFDDFTRVEEKILVALAEVVAARGGEVLVTLPFDPQRAELFDSSAKVRERLLRIGFVEEHLGDIPRASTPALAALARRLFRPPGTPLSDTDGVTLLALGDAEDEADSVVREVRRLVEDAQCDPGSPVRGWRDIGVVVRRLDDAAPRFEAAFGRLGVPLRLVGAGRALGSEPVVRALRGPLAVLAGRVDAGRFEARDLTGWLRWYAFAHQDTAAQRAVDDMEIVHRGGTRRSKGFPATLDAYRAEAPSALGGALEVLETARCGLIDAAGAVSLYRLLRGAVHALAPLGPPSGLDAEGRPRDSWHDQRLAWATLARSRVLEIAAALEAAALRTGLGGTRRVDEAVDELLDAIERSRIALPDRRLDAVSLMDAEEARFWELPVVFVAGLEEGRFPLRPREDVLLRDADREALAAESEGLDLPLARDRESRERRLFYVALTRARTRLFLTRAAYDDDGDPRPPSFFLRDVERVLALVPTGRTPQPGRVAIPLERCYTRRDLRLFAAATLGDTDAAAGRRRLARAILDDSSARVLERAERDQRPEADPVPGSERDRFRARVAAVSVSRLNHAVLCRYRFFLASVVELAQDDVPFEGPGYDARREGLVLHDALHRALLEPGLAPEEIAAAALAREDLDPVLQRLSEDEIARVVRLFRAREADTASPLAPAVEMLELGFADVALGAGDGAFLLRGSIDRVDVAGDSACVIDYKSSGSGVDAAAKAAKQGEDLQLPLYALALEASSGLSVVGVEWIGIRGRRRRTVGDTAAADWLTPRREGVGADLRDHTAFRAYLQDALESAESVVAAIRAGDHAKAPKRPDLCKTCPFEPVCRPAREGGRA